VIQDAAGENRNAAACAISSIYISRGIDRHGSDSLLSPILDRGICEVIEAVANLSIPSVPEIGLFISPCDLGWRQLKTYPGAMMLLLTPLGPSSIANTWLKASTPAFAALTCACQGVPL
jgi:hypothetical protein